MWGKEWHCESPHEEKFALLQVISKLQVPGMMVRRAVMAGREDDWSELTKNGRLSVPG